MKKHIIMLLVTAIAAVAVAPAHAESSSGQGSALHAVLPVANPCPRLAAGSIVQNPPSLFSQHGVLTANFSYQTTTDTDGRTLFCFMTPDGLENPTLRVHPGDQLVINVTNNTPAMPVEMHIDPPNCGDTAMTESSVNIHRSAGSVRWHNAEAPNRRSRRRSHRIAGRQSAREDREIAEHEDDGMMAIVRVVPAIASARPALAPKASIGADLARRK